jgi:hypothetical protein
MAFFIQGKTSTVNGVFPYKLVKRTPKRVGLKGEKIYL